MAEKNHSAPGLKRSLGLFEGITILIGITIGAGIYSTPQVIAGYQESFNDILWLWVIVGVFVYLGGLIYAELGTRLPNTGGEYLYLSRAFGPYVGFIFGWAQLFIIRTSPAAGLAIITVDYFEHFVNLTPFTHTALAILVILLLGTLNYVGIKQASIYQNISTIIKVGGLFLLVVAGLIMVQGQENLLAEELPSTSELGPFATFGATMMLIVFSYLGWDRVGYSAGEMKDPKRTIPLSLFWGIALVILTYLLAIFLYHYVLGMEGVRETKRVASDTATVLFGPVGAAIIAISVMFSASGSINGTMMTAPRVYYAMAKDKLFFRWFDYVHPTFRTPSRAIIAHCVWAIVILLVRQNFENIVAGMTFAVLIFYLFTTLALFKLRKQGVGGEGVYKVPLYPILPIFYFVGLLLLVFIRGYYEWEKSLIDLAFIATGIPFAWWFVSRR
ncbi:APC family permease [Flavilitoribacter nigricans]|uniref:APC family permease n=1 Tax=Flavilitoribacter nigricans TaxID=70997 RepID=UPI0014736CCD|nr:APC family permease [Flavilitoribacter nigricans]